MHSLSRLVLALLAGSVGTIVHASNVIELEELNWKHWVGNGKSALVEFWAPWCDHCQQLEPIYEELGDVFAHVKDKLVIAKVNGDALPARELLVEHDIKGLPTIKWFDANGKSEEYDPEGSRTLEDLSEYITKKTGLKPKFPQPPPPPPPVTVTQLNPENFDRIVLDPTKDVLVAFTATWCDHCQEMKPAYELIASRFRSEEHVVIANLDGDADIDKALAKKYGVEGYPIIKLFSKITKDKRVINYKLPKDEKNFIEFLNKYTGTQRAVGGGLNEKAGRSEGLDEIAKDFIAASPIQRKEMYKRAKPIALAAGKSGKQYLRIMDKLVKGNDDYLAQEKKRVLGMLKKRSLSEDKLDELKIKYNILTTFVMNSAAQKVADGVRIERSEGSAGQAAKSVSSAAETAETEAKRTKEEL